VTEPVDTPGADDAAAHVVEHAVEFAERGGAEPDPLPDTPAARRIERFVTGIGDAVSWIWLGLLAVIVLNVVMRYVFASGRIELEELQWHLYAVGFLVGIAYCIPSDSHVRVDFLRERMAPRTRAWIEWYGLLLLVLPFVALVVASSIPFVAHAWRTGEVSVAAGGLPARYVVKSALPVSMGLVGLATLARLLRVGRLLFGTDDGASASTGRDA